jgi:hypothetical protein
MSRINAAAAVVAAFEAPKNRRACFSCQTKLVKLGLRAGPGGQPGRRPPVPLAASAVPAAAARPGNAGAGEMRTKLAPRRPPGAAAGLAAAVVAAAASGALLVGCAWGASCSERQRRG